MRPSILLAPVTIAIAATLAESLKLSTVTVEGDTSATVKGWLPARRPVTRHNAALAVALAMLQSETASLRKLAHDAATGDRKAAVALAMACPSCWEDHAAAGKAIMEGKGGSRAIPAYDRVAQSAIAKGNALSLDYCDEVAPEGMGWWDDAAPAPAPILAHTVTRSVEWFRLALHLAPVNGRVGDVGTPAPAAPSKGKGRKGKGKVA